MAKRFLYLPSDYKNKKYRKVEGVAKTGEVSPKGTVAHVEDWEGRIGVEAAPAGMHYIIDRRTKIIRKMTHQELIEHGYFKPGEGPQ